MTNIGGCIFHVYLKCVHQYLQIFFFFLMNQPVSNIDSQNGGKWCTVCPVSLVCPHMSSGVIEGCVSIRVDSCQGKIKRVSAGVGERGASDGGPRCSKPTCWITWLLYNCVRAALPTALSLLNRPGLARPSEGAACLFPSLLLFSRFALLFSCSLLSWGWCGAVSPLFEGETITSHQSPSSPQGALYCYGDPLVAFCAFWSFSFLSTPTPLFLSQWGPLCCSA